MVRYGSVRYGTVWHGMVWYGMVWYGMVRYGMVENTELSYSSTVDSRELENGPGTIYAGFLSFLGFEVGGRLYSNFLAAAVELDRGLQVAVSANWWSCKKGFRFLLGWHKALKAGLELIG